MCTDTHVLMYSGHAAKDCVVANAHMTADRRMVNEDNMVADLAIVRDMRTGHRKAIVADPRNHSTSTRTRVHRDMLTNTTSRTQDKL